MDARPPPRHDALYELAPCGLLVATAEGDILHANGMLATWLQCRPEELRGRNLRELLTVGGRIFYQTHLAPLLQIQGSVAEVKLDLKRGDGTTVPALLNLAVQQVDGGTFLHAAVFVAEDRHRYERELLAQRQRAERLAEEQAKAQAELAAAHDEAANRAQFAERLVGVVSHDIRNPLSVIQMSTALLEKLGATEQQRPVIARVDRAVARVQHLLGDLLDFTQARLGRGLSVQRHAVDLRQVVAGAVEELAHAFPGREILFTGGSAAMCEADAQRVAQAIGNLVANAVAHGEPGRPVTVRLEGVDSAWAVSVHNVGRPIPPEAVERIFEPMVQGDTRPEGSGIGLGLYIVREIARRHGGSATVRSSPEEGTTFTLLLPRADA